MSKTQTAEKSRVTTIPNVSSGEGGIRTRGELSPTQHFQCCTFGRSVTSPVGLMVRLTYSACSILANIRGNSPIIAYSGRKASQADVA